MHVPPRVIAQALRVSANLICANPLPREQWIDFDADYWQINGQRAEDLGLWCLLVSADKEEVFRATLYRAVEGDGELKLRMTPPLIALPVVDIALGG